MPLEKINLIFIRHGQGCHNVIKPLRDAKLLRYNDAMSLSTPSTNSDIPLIDPHLTIEGVNNTIKNAKILKTILKDDHDINNIDIVLCSGLIRAMETAFYAKREFERDSNPLDIYVVPYLRELDESSDDPKSPSSRKIIDTIPAYAMLPVQDQIRYLKSEGINAHFNFDYLDPDLRREPGDINDFLDWLNNTNILMQFTSKKQLNILVVSHAGVLKHYTNGSFPNNTGFLETIFNNGDSKITMFDQSKFVYNAPISSKLVCPHGPESKRCNALCNVVLQDPVNQQKINLPPKFRLKNPEAFGKN